MPTLSTPRTAFPVASDAVPAPPSIARTTPGMAGTVCTVTRCGAITKEELADNAASSMLPPYVAVS